MKTSHIKKSFHEWKDNEVKKDSLEHGVVRYYRSREWYYRHYGIYCLKWENDNQKIDK